MKAGLPRAKSPAGWIPVWGPHSGLPRGKSPAGYENGLPGQMP